MERRSIISKAPRADISDTSYSGGNILGIEKGRVNRISYRKFNPHKGSPSLVLEILNCVKWINCFSIKFLTRSVLFHLPYFLQEKKEGRKKKSLPFLGGKFNNKKEVMLILISTNSLIWSSTYCFFRISKIHLTKVYFCIIMAVYMKSYLNDH